MGNQFRQLKSSINRRVGIASAVALGAIAFVLAPAFAQSGSFLEPFDGNPATPQAVIPSGWDVTFLGDLQPTEAQHGADCSPPPATHHVTNIADMVFICKGHIMTAINAGYGAIYLTPDAMLDFSQGEAVLKWDMSTLRTSARDWVDVVITPFDQNRQLSFENNDQHLPSDAVHLEMVGPDVFVPSIWRNGKKETVDGDTYHTYDMILATAGLRPDAARRDTFELHLSKNHIKFGMPAYNFWWVDKDISPLNWDHGVVQLNHRSYNPNKACNFDGSCAPDTWHWDNVSMNPASTFTLVRGDTRRIDATTSNRVTFPTPAPSNAFLRFVGIGVPIQYSLDGGATWLAAQTQGDSVGKAHPEIPDNFWTPIPAGTQSVQFRGERHGTINWEVSDISYWAASPSLAPPPPAVTQAAPAPDVAPAPETVAPAPSADGNVSFDGLSGTNQPLTGQYPSNVIDWGSGEWWLAAPYAQFTSNSVSFNGDALRSAELKFVAPKVLSQLDIDNGGAADSVVSLTCDGQPPVQTTVAPGQLVTIETGWLSPCSSVTIGSSNGWDTNFDNFRLESPSAE